MRYLNLFLLLPAFLLLASCSEDVNEQEKVGLKTIVAGADSYDKSGRTAFEEGADGKMLGVYWSPGDVIGVFSERGIENAKFQTNISKNEPFAKFTGPMSGSPAYAYYPYADGNMDMHAIAGSLPVQQSYSVMEDKLSHDYKYGVPKKGVDHEFVFTHFFPMIRFVIDATGSIMLGENLQKVTLTLPVDVFHYGNFTADAVTGTVNWTNENKTNELTMIWTDTPALTGDKKIFGYLFMDAASGLLGKQLQVTLTTNKQTKTFKSPLVINSFNPNYIYNVPLTLTGWEDQFVDPNPGDDGLHFGGGSADGSEILSVKPVFE